jgi:hypothetical protein
MTNEQLAERVLALEKKVEQLQAQLAKSYDPTRPWWLEDAGRFANDPVFDEIVKMGEKYRRSQRLPRKGRKGR